METGVIILAYLIATYTGYCIVKIAKPEWLNKVQAIIGVWLDK